MDWQQPRGATASPAVAAGFEVELARLVEEVTRLEEKVGQLTTAVQTNRDIGVAIGLVMHRYGLDRTAGHAYLVRLSQNSNVKLAVVAKELVDSADLAA